MIPTTTNSFHEDGDNSKCHVTLVTEVGGFDFTKSSVPVMVSELKWVSKEAIVTHFVYLRYFLEGTESNNENPQSRLPGSQTILEPRVSRLQNTITTKIFISSIYYIFRPA
jgi:hypothetical protein